VLHALAAPAHPVLRGGWVFSEEREGGSLQKSERSLGRFDERE